MSKLGIAVNSGSVQALVGRLREVELIALEQGKAAVTREMELAFEEAQERCPVATGATKSSGRVQVGVEGAVIEGVISYSTEYAPERHESVTHRNPEAYKWLERTMLGRSDAILSSLGGTYAFLFRGN